MVTLHPVSNFSGFLSTSCILYSHLLLTYYLLRTFILILPTPLSLPPSPPHYLFLHSLHLSLSFPPYPSVSHALSLSFPLPTPLSISLSTPLYLSLAILYYCVIISMYIGEYSIHTTYTYFVYIFFFSQKCVFII